MPLVKIKVKDQDITHYVNTDAITTMTVRPTDGNKHPYVLSINLDKDNTFNWYGTEETLEALAERITNASLHSDPTSTILAALDAQRELHELQQEQTHG